MKLVGIGERAMGARDGYHLVFERLAQNLQDPHAEFRQFVQEEHPAMGQ
jgi:hypothetical protein